MLKLSLKYLEGNFLVEECLRKSVFLYVYVDMCVGWREGERRGGKNEKVKVTRGRAWEVV